MPLEDEAGRAAPTHLSVTDGGSLQGRLRPRYRGSASLRQKNGRLSQTVAATQAFIFNRFGAERTSTGRIRLRVARKTA